MTHVIQNFKGGNVIQVLDKRINPGYLCSPYKGYCIKFRSGNYPRVALFNRKLGIVKEFPMQGCFEFNLIEGKVTKQSRPYFLTNVSQKRMKKKLKILLKTSLKGNA